MRRRLTASFAFGAVASTALAFLLPPQVDDPNLWDAATCNAWMEKGYAAHADFEHAETEAEVADALARRAEADTMLAPHGECWDHIVNQFQ